MKAVDKIEKICEGELVDPVTGPMMPLAVSQELGRVFEHRTPEDVVVVMRKVGDSAGKPIYQTSIYMSKQDFEKYGEGR